MGTMYDISKTKPRLSVAALAGTGLARLLAAAFALIGTWHDRARQRRELARLDQRLLRDIGVSRYDALAEARKPFWRA